MNELNVPEFLRELLVSEYGEGITSQIIKGYFCNRKTTFRVNTLKSNISEIEEFLKSINADYERVTWYEDAFILNNNVDIFNTEIFESGKIYVQSLSSMLPAIILDAKSKEDVLDMAAAPGGKTTQISAITNNLANVTACEMNKIRAEKLKFNVEKQGAKVFVMEKDARFLDNFFSFNKILLDSPCSGSGTLDLNNPNVLKYFTKELINKSIKNQRILISKAVNILKPGGTLVYSTCSVLKEENENIVNEVLRNKNMEIVPINEENLDDIPVIKNSLNGTITVMPTEKYEGFFVAKLMKK